MLGTGQVGYGSGDFSLNTILCDSKFLNLVNALPNKNFHTGYLI